MLVEALKENGCRFEYVTVDGDAHGWGLGVGTEAEGWIEKAVGMWEDVRRGNSNQTIDLLKAKWYHKFNEIRMV